MRDWTRTMWSDAHARDVWSPRFSLVQQEWFRVEVESVRRGLRRAGLVFGLPEGIPITPVAPNRYAIGPAAADLAMALARNDNQTVGDLLGYPSCCRDFFDRTWGAGLLDTTAQMTGNGDGPIECNILGRWMGVRLVMHLPCSWTCEATIATARRWMPLWDQSIVNLAREILSWPMEWSTRNGIVEVKYPVCKLSTRGTPREVGLVLRHGNPPAEGATGIVFPFEAPRRLIQIQDATALANGFSSHQAMLSAHAMVLEALSCSPPLGLTVDLGCGTGHLMRRIGAQFEVPVLGVESNVSRARGAEDIRITNLEALDTLPHGADTLVVSQRRFEEMPALEGWALSHARQVLVYSYDPPMFADCRKGLVHA